MFANRRKSWMAVCKAYARERDFRLILNVLRATGGIKTRPVSCSPALSQKHATRLDAFLVFHFTLRSLEKQHSRYSTPVRRVEPDRKLRRCARLTRYSHVVWVSEPAALAPVAPVAQPRRAARRGLDSDHRRRLVRAVARSVVASAGRHDNDDSGFGSGRTGAKGVRGWRCRVRRVDGCFAFVRVP